eukprot:1410036-Pyramimonas_sp.AAC.1
MRNAWNKANTGPRRDCPASLRSYTLIGTTGPSRAPTAARPRGKPRRSAARPWRARCSTRPQSAARSSSGPRSRS